MIGPDLAAFAASYAPLKLRRAEIKKEMERRAAALPVAPWAAAIRGFGPTGLAVTIGETGDLTNYPHWRMVWKRLGLMPVDGVACSRLKGRDLTAEQWTAVGYNPLRRAEIFACVGQSMAKHQWTAGAKSGTEFGLPTGPYGAVYVARREKTKADHPDWTKAHAYMDALRIMTKALISDLWSEWRRQHTYSMTSKAAVAGDASPFSSPGAGPERESPGAAP